MPYYDRIKADLDIFKKMMFLDVSDRLKLYPIRNPETEASDYLATSGTEDIKRYLPGAYVTNDKEALQKIIENIQRGLLFQGVLYNLTVIPENFVIGHILLHSPLAATNLNEWSIDFWVRKDFRNKGLMTHVVHIILQYMQKLQIKQVAATVDKSNIGSIKLLEKLGFGILSTDSVNGQILYGVSL